MNSDMKKMLFILGGLFSGVLVFLIGQATGHNFALEAIVTSASCVLIGSVGIAIFNVDTIIQRGKRK